MKRIGYMVIDFCEDWEQPLGITLGEHLPEGGILEWTNGARAIFPDRKSARTAIKRTNHYRLAFGREADLPDPQSCKIVPVAAV